jgi:hypothetical protein
MAERLNRRRFLAAGATGSAVIAAAGLQRRRLGARDTLEGLTAARVRELAPDGFTIAAGPGQTLPARLVEVREASFPPQEGYRQPFDVLFAGPPSTVLEDGIYTLEHPDFHGTQSLQVFLVRIGPDQTSPVYQAIFA